MAETPIVTIKDEAYLQHDVCNDLYTSDQAGNLLPPDDIAVFIRSKAADDPGYGFAASGYLEGSTSDPTEQAVLQEAFLLDVPDPALTPVNLNTEPFIDAELKKAFKLLDAVVEKDLSLLKLLPDSSGAVDAAREAQFKMAADALHTALNSGPNFDGKLVAIMKKRQIMAANAQYKRDQVASQRGATQDAFDRVDEDQPKPAGLHHNDGRFKWGLPVITNLVTPDATGKDGNPQYDGLKTRVRLRRPGVPDRQDVYPDDPHVKLRRNHSLNKLMRQARAVQVNAIEDTPLSAARANLKLQEVLKHPAIQESQAMEEILTYIPEIHGEREARATVDENYIPPAQLESMLQHDLDPTVFWPDPVQESRVFSTLANTQRYIETLDVLLDSMSPAVEVYRNYYSLRSDLMEVYIKNLYVYEERRIQHAELAFYNAHQNSGKTLTGIPDPIHFGNKYGAWYDTPDTHGRVPIVMEGATHKIFADGTYA